MRSRARSARIPRKLLRGQKMLDGISGEEIYKTDASTRHQRGMYMHKTNYDYLTTQQMESMLIDNIGGSDSDSSDGQGNESPSYSNLPFYPTNAAAIKAGLLKGMPYNGPFGVTYVT